MLGGIGKFLFGGEDDSGQKAAREFNEKAAEYLDLAKGQARRDVSTFAPVSEQNLQAGYAPAFDLLSILVPEQLKAFTQGNMGAQRAISSSGQEAMNAILGRPVNTSNIRQTPIDYSVGMFNRARPEFQSGSQAMNRANAIKQLYQDELGRAPDDIGFQYWSDRAREGMQPSLMRALFQQSPEYTGAKTPEPVQADGLTAIERLILEKQN